MTYNEGNQLAEHYTCPFCPATFDPALGEDAWLKHCDECGKAPSMFCKCFYPKLHQPLDKQEKP